jgi:xylan 1,4-beta-xylosidase
MNGAPRHSAKACAFALLLLSCRSAPPPHGPAAARPTAARPTMTRYENPIVPGFYPDPSICRVGSDYYLATSSFEYFPGVPILTSKDLVSWKTIGHALTRRSQLELGGAKSSQGIYAPTIRYHQGTFYLVTTNMSGGGSFFVTTKDPAGEWSEPVRIPESEWSMDPSLFFDDDGRVYYTRHGKGERGGIYQAELDLATGNLKEPVREIWRGTGGVWPEGPHLYKRGRTYYLLISEGGTSYDHAITVARSASPWGPFEPFAGNPILTHRDRRAEPIQATGHADLVETETGAHFLVFLGIRPPDGKHHHLGRETFLTPLVFGEDGWPRVNEGEPIRLEMRAENLPPSQPFPPTPARDDFDSPRLGPEWIHVRNPDPASHSLSDRPGWLRLRGSSATLDDLASPAFVGRRQRHLTARVRAHLEFAPDHAGQEAGLTLRQNEENHYDLVVLTAEGRRLVRLRSRVKGAVATLGETELPPGAVTLFVDATPDHYDLGIESSGGRRRLGSAPTAALSSESAGGFTGVVFGLFASGGADGRPPPADFDWFEISGER